MEFHNLKIKDIERALKTTIGGLTHEEAEFRLQHYGLNELNEKKKTSPFKVLLQQFNNIVIWILVIATVISAFLGEYIDAIVILIIIIIIGILGFIQEYRAEKAIEALKKMTSLQATVLRDNKKNRA